MLRERRKVGVSIRLTAVALLYSTKVILWQQTSSNILLLSEAAFSWTEATFFFYESLPINIENWQEMAPPFSLLSSDKEHSHKHTGTTR